ncbi:MAG: type I DNA topoisomerase [Candidatus Hydrogenedentota bacterium]
MSKNLVIVESPAKARSIQKYLGAGHHVIASMGHVMDLPKKGGVIIEGKGRSTVFTPVVEPIKAKEKIIKELKAAAKKATAIFLAPDPDREGEVIAHHIAELLSGKTPIKRVLFHEITPAAVKAAFNEPRDIDIKLVQSQQARRILDRIVGFDVSQLLWEKVARGLSAGRVQTVALRIIVEREREIRRFVPVESWSIAAELEKDGKTFEAKLIEKDGKKISIAVEEDAKSILADLKGKKIAVTDVSLSERRRNPFPPFITSTLQQEASRRLGMPVGITMRLAQQLYEGIDLGAEGPTGLITYMRTDSVRVSEGSIEDARAYIKKKLGANFLPEKPNVYKTKKSAQDAHEAIRPTSVAHTPASVSKFLDKKALGLYRLIWSRFVASQCMPAVYDNVGADLMAGPYKFRATGSTLKFPGFLKVFGDIVTDDKLGEDEEEGTALPPLAAGDKPALKKYVPRQHFTQPPPRFSEAALVKALEEKNIGRPSTYASIIATLKNRSYTHIEKRRLIPTDLGMSVSDLLVVAFPDIFNVGFTSLMEDELDEVEEGKLNWQKVLNDFHFEFLKDMKVATKQMPNLKAGVPTEFKCPACKSVMLLRYGKMGRFLACSRYPDCKSTFEVMEANDGSLRKLEIPEFKEPCPKCGKAMAFKRSRFGAFLACTQYPECRGVIALKKIGDEEYEVEPPDSTDRPCPTCGGPMEVKKSRFGRFLACEKYPECKGALPYFVNAWCPREGCGGELVERHVRSGIAYACHNFPECRFRSYEPPVNEPCPECGAKTMFRAKEGGLKCGREGCVGRREEPATDEEAEPA